MFINGFLKDRDFRSNKSETKKTLTQSQVHSMISMFSRILSNSKDRDSMTFLGKCSTCLSVQPPSKEGGGKKVKNSFFLVFKCCGSVFKFVLIASCPVTGYL